MYGNAFFFFAMILFLFVSWVATGGPNRPISFAGPFITPITDVGQEQQGYGSWWDVLPDADTSWWNGGGGNTPSSNTQRSLWETQEELSSLQRQLQQAKLFGTPSTYRGKVSIAHSSGPLGTTDPDEEYITISVSGSARENITISGWSLVSVRTKESARIPHGTTLFKSGSVNNTGPITLQPGEKAVIVTGRSPIGVSFRENSCVGYLSERQDFIPKLSGSCPSPSSDFDRFYNGAASDYQRCRDAVSSLPRCETPSRRPSGTSDACYSFMRKHLTYNSCVTNHANDRNFWGRTWRVYLGQSRDDLWAERNDTIKLLDAAGNTVDAFSY